MPDAAAGCRSQAMKLDLDRNPFGSGFSLRAGSRRDGLAAGSLFYRDPAPALRLSPSQPKGQGMRRKRIWDLHSYLHCSIVGTCLSTADLRQVLSKFEVRGAQTLSDHDLHKHGVALAGQCDGSAKLLHKALDRRHQRVISQFDKAKTEADVARLWDAAVQRGEIPGAYWSVLTHPLTGEALIKRVFGEVHMLSHLVGAANRADIRRLRELEEENAALRAKAQRQQDQIRDAVTAREAEIRHLNLLLAGAVAAAADTTRGAAASDEHAGLSMLVENLQQRLSSEVSRRQRLEERLKRVEERLSAERTARVKSEQLERSLLEELAVAESALSSPAAAATDEAAELAGPLEGQTVLYVGGMSRHAASLRDIAARFSAKFLHHDGGIEDRGSQLAGLISQARIVFFPVDCVSHDAMHLVKRLSRQAGKPYIPLRSAGLTSFLVALRAAGSRASEGNPGSPF